VDVSLLRFDPDNPRFGGGAKGMPQEAIQELLEKSPHYARELVPSLVENGFIPYEPLVVRKKGSIFVVIEGNRRLAAVRYIKNHPDEFDEATRDRLDRVPVLIFPNISKTSSQAEAIRIYLGVHHLFGFRAWPPESKAKFLDQQVRSRVELRKLSKEVGLSKSEFERFLIPYRLRKRAEARLGPIRLKDFWTLAEAINKPAVKQYLELSVSPDTLQVENFNTANLRKLLGYLYGLGKKPRVITETRQIGALSKVLASTQASAVLEKTRSLEIALLYVQNKTKTSQALAKKLHDLLTKIVRLRPSEPERSQIVGILETFRRRLKALH